jgi:uncharacterized protein YdaU (DUF1376 family)
LNHFRFHIGDYMKDTSHLSLLEHGVYTRLIQVYYTREAPIPEDQAARLIGARSQDERDALMVVLREFFHTENGNHKQARCQAEIDAWHLLSETQSKKGRDGAQKRWKTAKNGSCHKNHGSGYQKDSNGHDPAIEKNGRSIASQLPTPNSHKETPTPSRSKVVPPADPPPGLDASAWDRWLEYRRGSGKPLKLASHQAAMNALAKHGADQSAVVDQSIANGWQGLFALKAEDKPNAKESGRGLPRLNFG